jgi:hypothetical protein
MEFTLFLLFMENFNIKIDEIPSFIKNSSFYYYKLQIQRCERVKLLSAFSLASSKLEELHASSGGVRNRENSIKCFAGLESLRQKCQLLHRCCPRHIEYDSGL